jgi:leucyl aminopeptidase (aminopeptidase T)
MKKVVKSVCRVDREKRDRLQKGQDVVIQSNVATEDFAALVAETCYKNGAAHVVMRWYSQKSEKAAYRFQKKRYLGEVLALSILSSKNTITMSCPASFGSIRMIPMP